MNDIPKTESQTNHQPNPASSQDEGELWKHLQGEAIRRYEARRPSRRPFAWQAILIVVSLFLLPGIWWLHNLTSDAGKGSSQAVMGAAEFRRQGASASPQISTAIVVKDLSMEFKERTTPSPTLNVTAKAATEQAQERATDQAATAEAAATEWAAANITTVICERPDSYSITLVSGPHTSPRVGFRYISGARPPAIRALWTIENTGECNWDRIALWSYPEQKIVSPTLQQAGDPVTPQASEGDTLLRPGGQIDIVLAYTPQQAEDVTGEWAFIINDILLYDQPHISLEMENWVITVKATPTPTPKPRRPRQPEPISTETAPPERPTEIPPTTAGQ